MNPFALTVATAGAALACATRLAAQSTTPAPAAAEVPRLPLAPRDSAHVITFEREIFAYDAAGRRDPFVSLAKSSEIRPALGDLRLTTVAFDPSGVSSVAVLRNIGTKEQYRVKTGTQLGRMRVVSIEPKAVTFVLEEFGYSRQQRLVLGDSTSTRTP